MNSVATAKVRTGMFGVSVPVEKKLAAKVAEKNGATASVESAPAKNPILRAIGWVNVETTFTGSPAAVARSREDYWQAQALPRASGPI